jgi:hypothetical protein
VVAAAQPPAQAQEGEAVERAFRDAVALWAGERFDTLWEQADAATRMLIRKDRFEFEMRDRALRPACCFRQVQELRVTFHTPEAALVRATMGFDSRTRGGTFDATLTFYLLKEEGQWRVAARDFLRVPGEAPHRSPIPREGPRGR